MSTTVAGGTVLVQQRNLVTEIPGPRSQEKLERKKMYVADGVGTTLPVFIEAAGGGVLLDTDGNTLIDLASGIAVASVGNAAPAVVARVQEQVAAFTHTCFMITPYDSYVDVCEELGVLTPGDHTKKSALFNSGAEAVENAVKIARVATGRDAVAVFDHAYHGRTNLTMAMTAKNMPYKNGFGPFAGEVYRAPMSYPFRDGLSGEDAAARAVDVLEKQVGAENLACLAIEPIQGEGGFVVPAPGFLPALAAWSKVNGVLFLADEIQTGFCRTGDWFACDDEGVVPDLITLAKGIAGGLPLAAVTGRAELMDSVHVGGLGGGLRRQPGGLRRRPGRDRGDADARPRLSGRPARPEDLRAAAQAPGRPSGHRRRPRPRRHAGDRADHPGLPVPEAGQDRRGVGVLPPARRGHADLWHLGQRDALPSAAVDVRRAAGRGVRRGRGGVRGDCLTPVPRSSPCRTHACLVSSSGWRSPSPWGSASPPPRPRPPPPRPCGGRPTTCASPC